MHTYTDTNSGTHVNTTTNAVVLQRPRHVFGRRTYGGYRPARVGVHGGCPAEARTDRRDQKVHHTQEVRSCHVQERHRSGPAEWDRQVQRARTTHLYLARSHQAREKVCHRRMGSDGR